MADCPILWLFSFLLIKRFHSMSGSPVSRICADISAYATFRSVGRVQRLSGLPRNLTISHDTRLSCADQKAGVSCVAPVLVTDRATMKWGNVLPPSHKKRHQCTTVGLIILNKPSSRSLFLSTTYPQRNKGNEYIRSYVAECISSLGHWSCIHAFYVINALPKGILVPLRCRRSSIHTVFRLGIARSLRDIPCMSPTPFRALRRRKPRSRKSKVRFFLPCAFASVLMFFTRHEISIGPYTSHRVVCKCVHSSLPRSRLSCCMAPANIYRKGMYFTAPRHCPPCQLASISKSTIDCMNIDVARALTIPTNRNNRISLSV